MIAQPMVNRSRCGAPKRLSKRGDPKRMMVIISKKKAKIADAEEVAKP